MSNELPVSASNKKDQFKNLETEHANEIKVAEGVVTPFAIAVAIELEEFGLSKQKIEEIMLRSANRFGSMVNEKLQTPELEKERINDQGADFFGWIKNAGGQASDFVWSNLGKHVPSAIDAIAPIVVEALADAVRSQFKGSKTKSRKR